MLAPTRSGCVACRWVLGITGCEKVYVEETRVLTIVSVSVQLKNWLKYPNHNKICCVDIVGLDNG